ncbi:PREDICTED: uncharacterized protein LOC105369061 [Ceratosolen solmsi marchali]|uniref:Uncharacterized protein LOC105369061 n=1 Tax=Ceratosolen solmsi marchali TaxID=326594 RepID=A0AAJ7E3L8_9HYME|nr:PREDICTED: uncharacterized protein LOC105369061 [Ceratosolen solmsi marchali]
MRMMKAVVAVAGLLLLTLHAALSATEVTRYEDDARLEEDLDLDIEEDEAGHAGISTSLTIDNGTLVIERSGDRDPRPGVTSANATEQMSIIKDSRVASPADATNTSATDEEKPELLPEVRYVLFSLNERLCHLFPSEC